MEPLTTETERETETRSLLDLDGGRSKGVTLPKADVPEDANEVEIVKKSGDDGVVFECRPK